MLDQCDHFKNRRHIMATKKIPRRGSHDESSSVPYNVLVRRERSRELAQKRRTTYKTIMDDLTQVLPFPADVVSQLDYNSRLRLALCFFRLKNLMDHSQRVKEQSRDRMQLQVMGSHDQKPTLYNPGMLQDLMTEALDGFLLVTLVDGTIVYLSENIHKHLGLFQSEHIGVSMYDLILEDDHSDVRKSMSGAEARALARTSSRGSAEVSFFCRMKCSRFKVANTVTKNPGFKLVYVSGNLKVLGSDPFMVVMVRPVSPPSVLEIRMEGNMFVTHYQMDMTCTFFDGRLHPMLGYSKADLVGNVAFHLHHHDDEEATMQCSIGVMSRGEGLSGYYRFLTKYGTYLWLQTRATVMHDSRTGKPSYIVCMNFVINKDDGEKELLKRRAITAGKSSVLDESNRSHDPFPLLEREDGKVVNPFEDSHSNRPIKSEPLSPNTTDITTDIKAEQSSETNRSTTSLLASPGTSTSPDSQAHDASYKSSSPEGPCLPDSTTSSSSCTQSPLDSGSLDMGYHSDVSTKHCNHHPSEASSNSTPPNSSSYGPVSVFSDTSADETFSYQPKAYSPESYLQSSTTPQYPQELLTNTSRGYQQSMPYVQNSNEGKVNGESIPFKQQCSHTVTSIPFQKDEHSNIRKMNTHVLPDWEPQNSVSKNELPCMINVDRAPQSSIGQATNYFSNGADYHPPQSKILHNAPGVDQSTPCNYSGQQQEALPSLPLLTSEDLKVLDYIEQMGNSESITNVSGFTPHHQNLH